MIKVITYGTYDLLHHGHIRLLERAKALGDYLIVGVTSDDFDKSRGKINVRQSLTERMNAVRETGLADEIIVEEYEGQKIDDIRRYDVDIFTVGSDWIGAFDYLNEYCKVVYLERTEGISSTEIRDKRGNLRLGLVGESRILQKYIEECRYVNGIRISGLFSENADAVRRICETSETRLIESFEEIVCCSDMLYIVSQPQKHYMQVKQALLSGKHVLCESPIALSSEEVEELFSLAEKKQVILMEALKTAYITAYNRMVLLIKSGKVGKVVSVDATCTSLQDLSLEGNQKLKGKWNSICAWGPTAMLPVFQILGTDYDAKQIVSWLLHEESLFDAFTKIDFKYNHAVASIKVGKAVKSEGELIVSGTKGYLYVPAPWWKTNYFEIRYENPADNQRYFFPVEGEGIRYELVSFIKSIETGRNFSNIEQRISVTIAGIIESYLHKKDVGEIYQFVDAY